MTDDQQWCRNMWDSLQPGGQWGIPRSGLVFEKDEAELTLRLVAVMPHMDGMPISPAELSAQQRAEYEANREKFAEVGITITGEEHLATVGNFGVGRF